ncbi:hypothetical protein [Pectobacterium versatile]|uniref:hypothetical protein n=1 Tax=Pectobacterium versatile TaxID=2488639 RepID=UPI001B35DF34|nr:hypothetical protein [Pectobacterium versatile]MBQ4778589.1 hypothetical protein [Pectobacterium versatile]
MTQTKTSFPGILVRYRPVSDKGRTTCYHVKDCECFPASTKEKTDQAENPEKNESQDAQNIKTPLHEEILDDELHVNLWEIGASNPSPFMDIGVMIRDHENIDEVAVDLPWVADKKDISDLGSKLNGEKSVATIFNEVVHYDGFAEGNFANISFRRNSVDEKPFSLFRLNSQSFKVEEIHLSNETSSSRLIIKLPKYSEDISIEDRRKSAYIRFRIRKVPHTVYTVNFVQTDKALISSNIETRIIDFRINVLRGIPEELMHGNDSLKFPQKLKRIHCFLTTIRNEECVSVSKYYNGYRSLVDEDIWNEYIKLDNSPSSKELNSVKDYLGYQWTVKGEENENIKDLIVLGRFSKKTSNIRSILRFIGVVILLGAMGSGIWETLSISFFRVKDFLFSETVIDNIFINLIILSLLAFITWLFIKRAD